MLIINDDNNEKYYYFAVKSKLELYSSEWFRSKKESITNEDNCFQNALNDSLDYQRIKNNRQKISKLKSFINQYNWKDIKFPSDKEDWKKDTRGVQFARLMIQKTNAIFIGERIVLKSFLKI